MATPSSRIQPRPYRMRNKIQNYAWGAKNEHAFIPRLLGVPPEQDKPYAELWIGAHPNAPSHIFVDDSEVLLPEIIQQAPEDILGTSVAKKFDNSLPYLLKVLSAGEALSIQAHPTKSQAIELHKADPKNYPDDNHKPEIAIALTELTALVGFRPLAELALVIEQYPAIETFVGQSTTALLSDGSSLSESERLKSFYGKLMRDSIERPDDLEQALQQMEQQCLANTTPSEQEQLFLSLREQYGTDVGLFSLFLFNLVHLQPGEAIFLAAGVPHAYLEGNIVECMANSDNVVRAGLTPKFKDVATLVDILTYDTKPVAILGGTTDVREIEYPVPTDEFAITRLSLAQNEKRIERTRGKLQILLITQGELQIHWEQERATFRKGESILIPASLVDYTIDALNSVVIYRIAIP